MPLFSSHGQSIKRRALVVCVRSYRLGQPRTSTNDSCRSCNPTIKPVSKTAKAAETAFLPTKTKTSLEGSVLQESRGTTLYGCVVPADASATNRTVVGSPLFPCSNQSSPTFAAPRPVELHSDIFRFGAENHHVYVSARHKPAGEKRDNKANTVKKNTIEYFGGSSHAIRSLSSVLPPPSNTHTPAARPPLTGFFLSRSPPRAVDVP